MRILGIETSCDETGAAVVEIDDDLNVTLLSNIVSSSMDLHAAYGGVVPEIAARSHLEVINPVIEEALLGSLGSELATLDDAWASIDGIAVTYGAGLGGCLLIGVMTARTLAITKQKPLYACNHVEGHVYANFINHTENLDDYALPDNQPTMPLLALIVSGGHSQLAYFKDHFNYTLLGQTQDDAIGEAFDKVAKIIGLPYPGGPSISKAATSGNPNAFELPKAKMNTPSERLLALRAEQHSEHASIPSYDFSFSGLKTAVLRHVQRICGKEHTFPSFELPALLNDAQRADISATFQRVAIETVVDKTVAAFEEFQPASVVIAGGVAANQELRTQLRERLPLPIEYTDIKLCTDNGAMIATLGAFKAKLGQSPADPYTLEIQPNLSM